jgi:hypothetical protein
MGGGARRGQAEEGEAGTRLRQGAGEGAALGLSGRVARASWTGAGYRAWQIAGSRPVRWPVAARWRSRLGAARRCRDALTRGSASLPAGAEQGRGEKREGGREKRARIKIKFSGNFKHKLEYFEHKSCREFENLRLSFWIKVHLSFTLEVILNLRLLGFEFLFISCV